MAAVLLCASWWVAVAATLAASTRSASDDLSVLRSRFVTAMLPAAGSDDVRLLDAAAADLAESLGDDGLWPDLNYTTVGDEGRSWWEAGTHLQRAIILATAMAVTTWPSRARTTLGMYR